MDHNDEKKKKKKWFPFVGKSGLALNNLFVYIIAATEWLLIVRHFVDSN